MGRFALAAARDDFAVRSAQLSNLLAAARAKGEGPELWGMSEYCVIQLQDTWTRFVREVILRSSLGHADRANGTRLRAPAAGVMTFSAALGHLRLGWPGGKKPPYWEPRWFDRGDSAKALTILHPVNEQAIGAALGANTNPIEELRGVRNFVCHRGPTSAPRIAAAALALGVQWEQPSDIVNSAGPGAVVFDTWITRFSSVATAAIE